MIWPAAIGPFVMGVLGVFVFTWLPVWAVSAQFATAAFFISLHFLWPRQS